jgi:glycosyltransferase involved in cell wall biosynthesis
MQNISDSLIKSGMLAEESPIATAISPTRPDLSIVLPVYNEEENVAEVHKLIQGALENVDLKYEVIFVDDGSTDGSLQRLKEIAISDPVVSVIQLRRNFGQTAALSAGIDQSTGHTVVLMDADLQNDPADIPALLNKLDEGYDLVSGWRLNRQDHWLWRRVPSKAANRIISWFTGVQLHDYGCTLKAYRRELLNHIRLYGQMHRFIPVFASLVGASVTEIPVNHRPRIHGVSSYGLGRTFVVVLDLLTLKFLGSYSGNPIYLFGGSGLILMGLSFVSGFAMVLHKITYGISLIQTPLLLLTAMLVILGFHSILLGLTAELLIRTYHESQGKPTYVIRHVFKSKR